jgi:hypothetical protein
MTASEGVVGQRVLTSPSALRRTFEFGLHAILDGLEAQRQPTKDMTSPGPPGAGS